MVSGLLGTKRSASCIARTTTVSMCLDSDHLTNALSAWADVKKFMYEVAKRRLRRCRARDPQAGHSVFQRQEALASARPSEMKRDQVTAKRRLNKVNRNINDADFMLKLAVSGGWSSFCACGVERVWS